MTNLSYRCVRLGQHVATCCLLPDEYVPHFDRMTEILAELDRCPVGDGPGRTLGDELVRIIKTVSSDE